VNSTCLVSGQYIQAVGKSPERLTAVYFGEQLLQPLVEV
jgi:hypothetical protein